jgi:hypothetical protein
MANLDDINSIINLDSIPTEVKDPVDPYTYIEFISRLEYENSSEVFLDYYKEYLTRWAAAKNKQGEVLTAKDLVQSQTIELLKTITTDYTTYEEQAFLAGLNWNFEDLSDPDEKIKAKNAIYSALPIFVSRLKDIVEFYKKKRTEATFAIRRNRIKGTKLSVEKIIFDKILAHLFTNNPDRVDYVQTYMNISIDNYVDVYSDYFDIDRATASTADYNDIDASLYFELESILSEMIYDGNVYLREIPLIAQLSIDLSADCVGDKAVLKANLLANRELCQISDSDKILLKKKLYQKYLGCDYYYLYKDDEGNVETAMFIKADEPTNNLLNQQTVDTPTNESGQLELLKNIGLFFKPSKTSLLRVNTVNFSYRIDEDKVQPGTIYIFPDPSIYGNVAFNSRAEYPYIMEYSFSDYVKNFNFGWAINDPSVVTDAQALYPYYSREQDIDKLNQNNDIVTDFDDLYNNGYIATLKSDLYGNKFAIFKEQNGKFAKDWDITPYDPILDSKTYFLEVNGGVIGEDDQSGTNNVPADKFEWTALNHYYKYFIEGALSSVSPRPFRAYIPDGATHGNSNLALNYEKFESYLGAANVDGCSFETVYTEYDSYDVGLDTPQVMYRVDDYASQILGSDDKPDYKANSELTFYDVEKKPGTIQVFVPTLQKSITIEEAFPWWKTSVDKEIYDFFVNNAVDIDLLENVFFIKAINPENGSVHYMFEAITFDESTSTFSQKFPNARTIFFHNEDLERSDETALYKDAFNIRTFNDLNPVHFEKNINIADKGSEVFYVERQNKAYFAVMNTKVVPKVVERAGTTIPMAIYYPDIYEIDLANFLCKKFYFWEYNALNEQQIESFKIPDSLYVDGYSVIQKAGTPYLTYCADTNTFMCSYTVYDVNQCAYVYKHFFRLGLNGVDYYGEIDSVTVDSTVYGPKNTGEVSVISPEDKDVVLYLNFDTNLVVS